jgi:hypothetical protein
MIAIREPNQWPTAMGLYIVSYITYGVSKHPTSISQVLDLLHIDDI